MDVDLLARMVKELIHDHDEVVLPGVGTFVTEVIPSSFSDKGYTINPPYRRLSFRGRISGNDTILAEFYSQENDVDFPTAERILKDFLSEMCAILKEKKIIVLPGLGRLRATRENNFFFVADEDLDIYPDGFGLAPVSLKTHQETNEEVSAALASLKSMIEEPETTIVEVEKPEEMTPETQEVEQEVIEQEVVSQGTPVQSVSEQVSAMEEVVETVEVEEVSVENADPSEEAVPEHDTAVETENIEAEIIEPEITEQDMPEPAVVEPEVPEQIVLEEVVVEEQTSEPEVVTQENVEQERAEQEITETEVADKEEAEPVPEQDMVQEVSSAQVTEKKNRTVISKILIGTLAVISAVLIFLAIFLLLSRVAPDFIDSILYTKEELSIINYPL